MRGRMRRGSLGLMRLGGAVALILSLALVLPSGRATVLAMLLVPHFFPGSTLRPLRWVTGAPVVETVTVAKAPGRLTADIYRPDGRERAPAMILFLGVNPLPRSHDQVRMLADGLARSGIVTVVAESDALLNGEVRREEIDNLVALFQQVEVDTQVDPSRVGFVGFCIGAVMTLMAASDARIADRVAFVNAFSVYADLREVIRSMLSESVAGNGQRERWIPDQMTRSVLVRHLIDALPDQQDRQSLTREFLDGPDQSQSRLTAWGQSVRQLLMSHDVESVDRSLAALPSELLHQLDALSPSNVVGGLRATTFLMHDENDSLLPVTEARKLASLMPESTRGGYSEFRLFAHVVPGQTDGPAQMIPEMAKLIQHVSRLLQTVKYDPVRGSST